MTTVKLISFLILILLLICPVLAQPPFEPQASATFGIDIAFPKFGVFEQGKEFELHFHVHNSTNFLLTNETTSCTIHIYNDVGLHIIEQDIAYDLNTTDFSYTFNKSMADIQGSYTYIVNCNSTTEAGFISNSFKITESGELQVFDIGNVLIVSILVILFFLVLIYLGEHSESIYSRMASRIFGIGIILSQMVLLLFLVYLEQSGVSFTRLLNVNFWVLFNGLIGVALFGIVRIFIAIVNPATEDNEDKAKWVK